AHRSDHRRRHRQLRHARRLEYRRARRVDRFRRTACHRADHPAEASRGISKKRVSRETRDARRGGTAAADEKLYCQSARFLLRTCRIMTYPDSVRYLYALGNELKTAKFGLETITALLAALDNPERSCRFAHVAGTNGKGSTCAMIESALRVAGMRTGLYTSPHLAEPTERIRIAGHPASREQFAEAFDLVHAAAE